MDMFSDAGVLGIFCIFAILLVKEVLPLIKKKDSVSTNDEIEPIVRNIQERANRVPELERILRSVASEVSKTLEMHEKYDSDGRPIWYIKEELEENIKIQKELLNRQNVVLEKIASAIEGQTRLIERMLDDK